MSSLCLTIAISGLRPKASHAVRFYREFAESRCQAIGDMRRLRVLLVSLKLKTGLRHFILIETTSLELFLFDYPSPKQIVAFPRRYVHDKRRMTILIVKRCSDVDGAIHIDMAHVRSIENRLSH